MINYFGVGKKKNSVAKVYIKTGNNKILINKKFKINEYFHKKFNYNIIFHSLYLTNSKNFEINADVKGGGKSSQIIALRSGLAKALLKYNKNYKKIFSDNKLLTRDSRMVERKKIGRHKSRKSKQFSKR